MIYRKWTRWITWSRTSWMSIPKIVTCCKHSTANKRKCISKDALIRSNWYLIGSSGNYSVRNLNGIVKKEHCVLNSEYLTTLFVAVPKQVFFLLFQVHLTDNPSFNIGRLTSSGSTLMRLWHQWLSLVHLCKWFDIVDQLIYQHVHIYK